MTRVFRYTLSAFIVLLASGVYGANIDATSAGGDAQKGLLGILLIIAIPAVIVFFFVVRFIYAHTVGKRLSTTLLEDYRMEADAFERAGKFVSAGAVYEQKLKDPRKAAALYEKGGDFRRAAALYDLLDMSDKARELYEKDGNMGDAAEAAMRDGDYEGAAKLYERAGKKADAAEVLERSGRRLAAVRAYREAGEYRKAARLLEEEGMLKEAAEMFGMALGNTEPDKAHIGEFYAFAFMLEKAGENEKALAVYRRIAAADPSYRDVADRINALSPQPQEKIDLQGKTTLRSFIRPGGMEPKYGLKLWVHLLRRLQDSYGEGRGYGLLTPENVLIDSQNNISFLNGRPSAVYTPPEAAKGAAPDIRADIYCAGVILYELLTGGIEGLGSVRVVQVAKDVPDWLDEIVIRCIKKVREDRYQGMEEIFADLRRLSKEKKGEGA